MSAPATAAVLFDLDGTLVDTAPDMAGALNDIRAADGLPPLPFAEVRPHVSHGSTAMVKLGYGLPPGDAFEAARLRFLNRYAERLAHSSALFPGGDWLLHSLEAHGLRWGIVTNKPGFLTDPLVRALGLYERAACVVAGDTLPQRKPHPAPLLLAASQAGVDPAHCVYVGDAERDVQAGRAAGMRTLVARFGYLQTGEDTLAWGADGEVQSLPEVATWLGLPAPR